MPPKKQQPIKKDPKSKKDEKKQEEIPEPIKEPRYQQLPQNIKSKLEEYKLIVQGKQDIKVKQIIDALVQGIINEKSSQKQQLKILINQKGIRQIFQKVKQGKLIITQQKQENHTNLQLQLKKLETSTIIQRHPPVNKFQYHSAISVDEMVRIVHLFKFQQLFRKKFVYRNLSFVDRNYEQKLTRQQFSSILSKQVVNGAQYLKTEIDGKLLIALFYQNPPGRNIYKTQKIQMKPEGKLDYWINQILNKGGASTRLRFMYPADNAILVQKVRKVGMDQVKQLKVTKKHVQFGINRETNKKAVKFWVKVNNLNLKIQNLPKKIIIQPKVQQSMIQQKKQQIQQIAKEPIKASPKKVQIKKVQPKSTKKGDKTRPQPQPQPQPIIQSVLEPLLQPPAPALPIQYSQTVYMQSLFHRYTFSKYVTVFSKDKNSNQLYRQYGPQGQVIRHYLDKSIYITYKNGNTSTYKSGYWTHIVDNKQSLGKQTSKQMGMKVIQSLKSNISIRSDSTVFIQKSILSTIIYADQTVYKLDHNLNTITITHPSYPVVRIRYDPIQISNQNVLGEGTSYAYLGHQNLFQRCFNGHIFQLFDEQFSMYRYQEKMIEKEQEPPKITEVTLLYFKQGSVLKSTTNQLLFMSSEDIRHMRQVGPSQHWLQLFTTLQNRKEGVYTINMVQSSIQTLDNQGNFFKLNMLSPSIIKTAVSLNINDQKQQQPPNEQGYFVNKQNYFLPTPVNYIHPRLFVVHKQFVKQYMNQEMLNDEIFDKEKYGYLENSEISTDGKQYIQIHRKLGSKKFHPTSHEHTIQLDTTIDLEKNLKEFTSTIISRPQVLTPQYEYRQITKHAHILDFSKYQQMVKSYNQSQDDSRTKKQKISCILSKNDLY